MSKTSKAGLTRSRKIRVRNRAASSLDLLDCMDGVQQCFATIQTLAGLLEVAANGEQTEFLKSGVAGHAGTLILAETQKARQWLNRLKEQMP